jgi:hypothetical protein
MAIGRSRFVHKCDYADKLAFLSSGFIDKRKAESAQVRGSNHTTHRFGNELYLIGVKFREDFQAQEESEACHICITVPQTE